MPQSGRGCDEATAWEKVIPSEAKGSGPAERDGFASLAMT